MAHRDESGWVCLAAARAQPPADRDPPVRPTRSRVCGAIGLAIFDDDASAHCAQRTLNGTRSRLHAEQLQALRACPLLYLNSVSAVLCYMSPLKSNANA